jgi:hypothetical protein
VAMQPTRRHFLHAAATSGAMLGLGDLSAFRHLARAEPPEAKGRDWQVRYGADIEPIVRLIEETPTPKCTEVMLAQLRRGLSYRDFMTGLFLAGLRNGGDLGYYHCIYMIHSANQLGLDAPVGERLLAMFGCLALFKYWQERRSTEPGHFGMQKSPSAIRDPDKARAQFHAAMVGGDADAAEQAVVSLVRSEGSARLFDLLGQYGFREGVHNWIFVSNSCRILESLGWDRGEPVFRAMARYLAGKSEWQESWYIPGLLRCKREIEALPASWAETNGDAGMTRELLAVMREKDADGAFQLALRNLAGGKIRAGAVWDAVHLAAGEAYIRGDTTNGLHSNTGLNALHYAFRASGDRDIRLQSLMRAVSWLCQPISAYPTTDTKAFRITEMVPADIPADAEEAADAIMSTPVSRPWHAAAGKALAFAQKHADSQALWQVLRRKVFMTGDNAHDFKFLAAIWEDSQLVSPQWRPCLVAASVGKSRYSRPDSESMQRLREALRKL